MIILRIVVTVGDQFISECGTVSSKDSWIKDCVVMCLRGSDCGVELPDPRRSADAQLWVFRGQRRVRLCSEAGIHEVDVVVFQPERTASCRMDPDIDDRSHQWI